VGLPDLDVELLSVLPWESAARVVDRMQVGRVFFAGDAAHVMPPAGGFGLNTGVQDAHNLAWKLAAVLKGAAGPALLQTYDAERQPVARMIVAQAVREGEAPTPDAPPWAEDGPPGDGDYGPMAQLAFVLGYHYDSAAAITSDDAAKPGGLDPSGRPGARAPHIWLERAVGRLRPRYRARRLSHRAGRRARRPGWRLAHGSWRHTLGRGVGTARRLRGLAPRRWIRLTRNNVGTGAKAPALPGLAVDTI
jgi:putative polyketide hydroxylase